MNGSDVAHLPQYQACNPRCLISNAKAHFWNELCGVKEARLHFSKPAHTVLTSITVEPTLITISILSLLLFGVVHFFLGITWNAKRFRLTYKYSTKYRTIWVIGLFEILVVIILLVLQLL